MKYHVNVTEAAERDMKEAAEYIARNLNNQSAAVRLLDETDAAAESLSKNPLRQPLVRDDFLAALGLRLLTVNNYNLFYIVREQTNSVSVIRFVHSRRDWANLFAGIELET